MASAAESKAPAFAAEPPPEIPNAKWPKAWGEDPQAEEVYARALEVAGSATADDDALVRTAVTALLPFARRARRAYARRGFISFDGLLRRARDLVRDRADVRERLKQRFKALLIDEFQDTDPLQGELLLLLAERPGGRAAAWQDAVAEPGRLFVVGDPKQSIYRFRGADIAAYQGFTGRLLEQGALACDLTANFRCRPGLVEPVNRVFEAVMRAAPGAQPAYKAIRPARPAGDERAVEVVAVTDPGDGLDAAATARTEAAWAARWIAEGRGALPLSGVAVLLRSSTSLPYLLDAFKRGGIPYAVDLDSRFYGAQEVVDFLNLLRALDDPGDRVALAGLLRSPLGGATDDELLSLARAGALDYRRDPAPRVLPEPARCQSRGRRDAAPPARARRPRAAGRAGRRRVERDLPRRAVRRGLPRPADRLEPAKAAPPGRRGVRPARRDAQDLHRPRRGGRARGAARAARARWPTRSSRPCAS